MKKIAVLLMALVFGVMALGGCVPADCKDCRWWSYSDGQKYYHAKWHIKPFAEKMEKEARENGNISIRVAAGQSVPLPKEFSLQIVKATNIELPELTDETFAEIKERITEWLKDNGWTIKESADTSLSSLVTINCYKEGSLTGRIVRGGARFGSIKEEDRAEIRGSIMLQNGADTILDMDLAQVKTSKKGITEGKYTSIPMKWVQETFAQIIVDTLMDYQAGKITSNK